MGATQISAGSRPNGSNPDFCGVATEWEQLLFMCGVYQVDMSQRVGNTRSQNKLIEPLKIHYHTPEFHVKIGNTLTNFGGFMYKRYYLLDFLKMLWNGGIF